MSQPSVRSRSGAECAEYEEKLAVLERRYRSLTMEKEDLNRNLTCRSSGPTHYRHGYH